MQKISNRLYLLFVLMSFVFGIFGLTSCSEGNKTSLKLSFEQNEYQLEVGEQIEVEPIFKNAGEEPLCLVWKSYNTSVVSVNDGVLEGVGVGKTEVKVFISGNTNVYATLTVKVTAKNQMPVAKFNEVPATLYVGDELQLTYELANAENECEFVYQSLTDAATVDQTGLIKVLEEGYALVTVKVTDKVTGQYVNYNFSFEVLTNYDITYVVDEDVNNEENPSFYIANQKDVVLKEPTKIGYSFKGWYEDEEFTKPISVIDVDRKENITLYAQWDAIKYSIEYNENEGKMPTYNVPSEYQYGTITELPRPRLAGYKFAGWYENENFEGEALFEINDKTTENKVLYAKYVESIVEVSSELDTSKVYKLGMYQGNINKTLFMVGTLSGYYGVATEKLVEAADVKVVEVEGGYNLKVILADGTIKYIDMVASGSYYNIKFNDAPATVWEYNSEYNTFTTKCGSETVYMGAYSTYDTFSGSEISYAATSFVSHLYEEIEYTDEMKAKDILDEIVVKTVVNDDYKLPIVDNVSWSLEEDYDFAEINDGVLSVVRQKEDKNINVVATLYYNDIKVTKTFVIKITKEIDLSVKNIELNATNLALTSSYGDGEKTISDVQFNYSQLYYKDSGIQIRTKDGVSSKIWNETEMREIKKIVIKLYKQDYSEKTLTVNFGNDINCSDYSTTLTFTAGVLEYDVIPNQETYKYFRIEHSCNHTTYINSIKVIFELTDEDYANAAFKQIDLDENKTLSISENYELPKVDDISWSLNGTYDAADLNDNVIEIVRQKEDVFIEVKAQYKNTNFVKIYKFKIQKESSGGIEYVEKTYTYTFTSKVFTALNQTMTFNSVNWKLTGTGGTYWGYDSTKGQQFGSGSAPFTALNLESASFNNVTKIVINTSGAKSINAKLKVYVGSTQIGSQISLSSSATSYTFSTEMISGAVKFAYTQTSKKAIYIKSITITYNEVVQN